MKSSRGLVEYNARRCEEATGKVCDCACGGQFHGQAHSREWVDQTAARFDAERDRRRAEIAAQQALFLPEDDL